MESSTNQGMWVDMMNNLDRVCLLPHFTVCIEKYPCARSGQTAQVTHNGKSQLNYLSAIMV